MIRSERSLTLATASCNTVSLSAFLSLASHVLATWFVCRLTEYLPYEDPLRNCAHIYRAGNLITKKNYFLDMHASHMTTETCYSILLFGGYKL